MADHTAIVGVTKTLKTLLDEYMVDSAPLAGFEVTSGAPDTSPTGTGVNVFLVHIRESAALKNQEIPGQGHQADYGKPPLSLDLDYLITAYGGADTEEETAQSILGEAMLVLHDFPIITDTLMRRSLPTEPILDGALRGEFERVKITFDPISVEDLTKIWTATTQPYRLSVAYKVGVVQIESRQRRRMVQLVGQLPAAGPRAVAVPLDRPRIDSIGVLRGGVEFPVAYAGVGEMLVINGSGLSGAGLDVLFGREEDPGVIDAGSTGERLLVTVPDVAGLQPGAHNVVVRREIELGDPPVPHAALSSNLGAFVLVPTITSVNPAQGSDPTTITIQGERLFNVDLPSVVWVHNRTYPLPDPDIGPPPSDTEVQVIVDALPADPGNPYRVAVRVNGAESVEPGQFEVTP
jgi:hypothetical protein